jgi:hypothetical protein
MTEIFKELSRERGHRWRRHNGIERIYTYTPTRKHGGEKQKGCLTRLIEQNRDIHTTNSNKEYTRQERREDGPEQQAIAQNGSM